MNHFEMDIEARIEMEQNINAFIWHCGTIPRVQVVTRVARFFLVCTKYQKRGKTYQITTTVNKI
jgi:hypothetical protein